MYSNGNGKYFIPDCSKLRQGHSGFISYIRLSGGDGIARNHMKKENTIHLSLGASTI
ncbi:MAG: hypothetical protein R3A12_12675 [Ignavibacteria bacterium]